MESIIPRLPKSFVAEYEKRNFHDHIIDFFALKHRALNRGEKYDFELQLMDYTDNRIHHYLTFVDVTVLKCDMDFTAFAGYHDWYYSEILPVDDKRFSLEVRLFDESSLYIEFNRLRYKKKKEK